MNATVTRSFLECDRCYRECRAARKPKHFSQGSSAVPSVHILQTSLYSDLQLLDFVARFRKRNPGVLLPNTEVGKLSRYNTACGDACASIRTNQHACPVSRKTHDSNTMVIRFNFTRNTFGISCYQCNDSKPFFQSEIVRAHPYNCECWPCFQSEIAELYERD